MLSWIHASGLFTWMYLDSEVRSYRSAGKHYYTFIIGGSYSTRLGNELLLVIYSPELWSNPDDPK